MSNQITELQNSGFSFKKQFGQNFLTDLNLLSAIVSDSQIGKDSLVLEIGTGAGTLTQQIANKAKKVVSYEIDEKLKPYLEKKFKNQSNLKLIFADFMKQSDTEILKDFETDKKISVIANLPYYITTPIIFKLLEMKNVTDITIMVQKEVAQRICSKPKNKDYGILSVKLQAIANVKITRQVNRQLFCPPPNVDSAVLNIVFDEAKLNEITDHKLFSKLVDCCFNQRRKTLNNNLKSFGLTAMKIEELFNELNLKPTARAEELSIQQFTQLSNLL